MSRSAWIVVLLVALVPPLSRTVVADEAKELLRKHREASAWLDSVSMWVRYEYEQRGSNPGKGTYEGEFACDGKRYSWVRDETVTSLDGSVKSPSNGRHADYFGNKFHAAALPWPNGLGASVQPADERERQVDLNLEQFGFAVDGRRSRFAVDGKPARTIADVLADAPDLRVRPTPEVVDGASCRVVEGTTRFGRFTLWIDPARGHHALKCVEEIRPGDEVRGERFEYRETNTIDQVKLERVGDVWVVAGGRHAVRTVDGRGKEVYAKTSTCTRSEVKLKPDWAKVDAFRVSLPVGTRVRVYPEKVGPFGGSFDWYTWSASKPVDVDQVMAALTPAAQ